MNADVDVLTLRYGPDPAQQGQLYRPDRGSGAVLCLLHGGFWRMPYGREQFDAVARDVAGRGMAVWNIGYRRVGAAGGGWPGTCDDAAAAVDFLATVAAQFSLDLGRVWLDGHSAGGHLAAWVAAQSRAPASRVRPRAVALLAGVLDLRWAHELDAGRGAVAELLGGAPAEQPDRFASASPIERLPLGVRQFVLHGGRDTALPAAMSARYAQAARAAGDAVEFVELAEAGHMDFLDPGSEAHARLLRWLEQEGALALSPVRSW